MSNDTNNTSLSLNDLFCQKQAKYLIPMYQRNYAWEEREIHQLLTDIIDSHENNKSNKDKKYYIGTLVVYQRSNDKTTDQIIYEVIDGQQRLTTLNLLMCYLQKTNESNEPKNQTNLIFENRESSNKTLNQLFSTPKEAIKNPVGLNQSIIHGYKIIDNHKKFKSLLQKEDKEDFITFIKKNIILIRICVPEDTDLNHYFEIMNSRGEQLEKHEVLKANLMGKLHKEDKEDKKDQHFFHTIWEACSNMEQYVQMGFSMTERKRIFGEDWNTLITNKDCLYLTSNEVANPTEEGNTNILNIIKNNPSGHIAAKDEQKDTSSRFSSVVNFPNFLLHVLNVYLLTKGKTQQPLDDKRLIESFETLLELSQEEIKEFSYTLLKCRFLYDKYIIKHETTSDGEKWSLKQISPNKNSFDYKNTIIGNEDEEGIKKHRHILMLLSAFHVSYPSQSYKHWLNAALYWLYQHSGGAINPATKNIIFSAKNKRKANGLRVKNNTLSTCLINTIRTKTNVRLRNKLKKQSSHKIYHLRKKQEINPKDYLFYLETLAKEIVRGRLISRNPLDYEDLIKIRANQTMRLKRLLKHLRIRNIDYQKLRYGNIENNFIFNYLDYILWKKELGKAKKDKKIEDFKFTFRSSVEHFSPQHPIGGEKWNDADLNSFGNLCLISHSKNSKLSNHSPSGKKEYYAKSKTIDSIKQYLMMQKDGWTPTTMQDHYNEMKGVLRQALGLQITPPAKSSSA